jgi:hypothetical protein
MKTKMLALLEDTIQFYSEDTSRRSVKSNGAGGNVCYYSFKGKKCAIGRLLTPEELELWAQVAENKFEGLENSSYRFMAEICGVPVNLQGFDPVFLTGLQSLHDNDQYWDENGLTENGKEQVATIKWLHFLDD